VQKELTYDTLAVDQIVIMTSGQPYLTQLICRNIVNRLNNKVKSNYAVINDVDAVVEEIISAGDDKFSLQLWEDLSIVDRLLLSVIAEQITGKNLESISFQSIYNRVSELTDKYSSNTCLDSLSSLTNKEVLLEKFGYYRFGVRLFMRWVFKRYPAMKMREVVNASNKLAMSKLLT
jgi:DNA topoisomerase VI subunit A